MQPQTEHVWELYRSATTRITPPVAIDLYDSIAGHRPPGVMHGLHPPCRLRAWHMVHAAHPRLTPQIRQEHPHQLVQIDAIGVGAPRPPVHLDARRVENVTDHALRRQPALQPMPVKARFEARQNADRPAALAGFAAYRRQSRRQPRHVARNREPAHFLQAGSPELPFWPCSVQTPGKPWHTRNAAGASVRSRCNILIL
jgi:hypothetical protein